MALLSKIKKLGQKVATGVYNTVNAIGGALKNAGGQTAGVASAPVLSSQKPGTLYSPQGKPIGSTSTGKDIYQANATSGITGKPVYIPPGGNAPNATSVATGQPVYKGGSSSSSGSSSESLSYSPPLGTQSEGYTAPTTISSRTISSSDSSGSSSGSINLPSQTHVDASGALAGVQAGTKPTINADGTQTEYDPKTGLPVAPKEVKDPNQEAFDKYLKGLEKNKEASLVDQYDQAEKDSGVVAARQEVNNFQAQLNAITAKAETDQLSLVGQGRGIPEAIIGGQQAAISREAAIKALPIAAQLAAAQGNLQLAEQHLETRFNLLKADAKNEYEYKNKVLEATYNFATASEKRKLEELKSTNDKTYKEHNDFLDVQNKLLLTATTQKAPVAVINAIKSATNVQDVIAAAGVYGAKIEKDTSNDGYTFTSTQSNTGASNAGVDVTTFKSLPGDVQNLFVNSKDTAQLLVDDIASVRDGSMSHQDAMADINSQNVSQATKDYFINLLGSAPAETSGGGGFWDWIGGFFKGGSEGLPQG